MFHLRHSLRQAEGDTGGDTGGSAANGQTQQGGGQKQQTGDKNNTSAILNPWRIPDKIPSQSGQQPPQQNQQQSGGQPRDANAQMADFVKGLRLTDGIDLAQVEADLKDGNTDSLSEAFNKVASNTFQQSMIQMNRLMENRIKNAVDDAVKKSGDSVNTSFALRELHSSMPFTKDPAIEPVAKAALQAFMRQPNADMAEAVKQTEQFFEQVAGTAAKHFKMIPPQGDSGGLPFGGGNIGNASQLNQKTPDWLELLTGESSADEE